jgi:hypothetical protein
VKTLVLVNSFSPRFAEAGELVLPYLEHFGVLFTELDLAHEPLPADAPEHALIVVAHARLDPHGTRLGADGREALLRAVARGAGLVSFDPTLPSAAELGARRSGSDAWAETFEFSATGHSITKRHSPGSFQPLLSRMRVPSMPAPDNAALLTAGGKPLLAATVLGQGRVVQWATAAWMRAAVLGPMAGLDDLVWRGLVWAARKPFALRGLAPLVTMRVDDVAGCGTEWSRSPFYWVHDANRHGFKPWLGIFVNNLSPAAVHELRDLIQRGQATAFPHALGMSARIKIKNAYFPGELAPGRRKELKEEFRRVHGAPPSAADLDEFIYFDHLHKRPWSDGEAARRLELVDRWYAEHAPLPMSRYAVPHWYEIGSNVVGHLRERWGIEFTGAVMDPDLSFSFVRPLMKSGPFRRFPGPRAEQAVETSRHGERPFYFADWLNLGGHRFFNCLTEIRDDAGYDWAPDNDVEATVGRGVRQLRRALDGMALAVLFAHETDHLYAIRPEAWSKEIARVAQGIVQYSPLYVTMDDALCYVRATRTSRLESARVDASGHTVTATFRGFADVGTHFRLFTDAGDDFNERLVEVPPFTGQVSVDVQVQGEVL